MQIRAVGGCEPPVYKRSFVKREFAKPNDIS